MPLTVGAPLMVTVLFNHEPLTPAGKPVKVAPVAPVVVSVIVVMALLIHVVRLTPAAIVFNGFTVTVICWVVDGQGPALGVAVTL